MTVEFQAVMTGTPEQRVEGLKSYLGYPFKELDPSGSRFWYLRPGEDEDEAEETCPIAIGFYSELNDTDKTETLRFLTSDAQQKEIHDHYLGKVMPDQPVMYLLLPEAEQQGLVAMILPTETKLRQRQIQTFAWNTEDLQARLRRLRQDTLERTGRFRETVLESIVPLVEWAFYKPITTARELAQQLAEVSRKIEQAIPAVYEAEGSDGYLHNLLLSFQRELLPTLKLEAETSKDYSFADIYAQTIAYGLFTARVFSYTVDERRRRDKDEPLRKETDFNRQNAWALLPETNPFLRRLFRDVSERPIDELGDALGDAISEVFSILRAAKMDAILEDFRSKMNREDIVIRFYEDFLAAYKPEMRERRGVYYTPEPVVSYMVRSVDILLKEKFNKPLGLADPEVMILDPACGTGTFLLWIFQLIYQRFEENPEALTDGLKDKSWSGYVKERLLPRIFGFELLMAPYAICHLKLGLFLEEKGYRFNSGQRLGVFLTNSLDESVRKSQELFEEFIAEESDQASSIKLNKPIMVVVGNPPYEGESANKNILWINQLVKGNDSISNKKVENYFEVDGKTLQELGERNTKWLNNDYVKFIRFSHWRIENTTEGIVCLVTDRSFLEGTTFRGMRQSLLSSFDHINILDLHGNVRGRRKEALAEDENVFEIIQGIAISFLVKNSYANRTRDFSYAELWGRWQDFSDDRLKSTCKAAWLAKQDIKTTQWSKSNPAAPYYIFDVLENEDESKSIQAEYEKGWKITDIFNIQSMGITGGRDKSELCPRDNPNDVWEIVQEFVELPVEEAREKYSLGKDARDWKVALAQEDIRNSGVNSANISPILFRPFDVKFTYYTGNSRGFHCMPRKEVMDNMFCRENVALCFTRSSREGIASNFFVSSYITDKTILSSSDNANIAPLYIYQNNDLLDDEKASNISIKFSGFLEKTVKFHPSPYEVFCYIYSILYCPTYRDRYFDLVTRDFARIPITQKKDLFRYLAALGDHLIGLHLMKPSYVNSLLTQFEENGDRKVAPAHPQYENGKVFINKQGDCFTDVPEEVWNVYIGGYQVCHKWLKDRKGRTLSDDDILHYQRIVVALKETITLMEKIDEAIPSWPIE